VMDLAATPESSCTNRINTVSLNTAG
jgi:hypothetical protein